jgi:hypothetical protein
MQATTGLTANGLLYEGSDFSEWMDSLRPIFAHQFPGFNIVVHSRQDNSCWFSVRIPFNLVESDVCACIWWHVSPHIRSRVSKDFLDHPTGLISILRATARPFRFLELPAEVRLKVYRLALATFNSQAVFMLRERKEGRGRSTRITNNHKPESRRLLSINRQIRLEVLPVLHQLEQIWLIFEPSIANAHDLRAARSPDNAKRVHAINRWASKLTPDSTRQLRKLSVQLPLLAICNKSCQDMLHFTLSHVDGKLVLTVENHAWLDPKSQLLLSNHAAATSKLAQSLRLEGEALIMVLAGRPDLWDQLELADE